MSDYNMVIVEDDDKLRRMLADYFAGQGFRVVVCDNGEDAAGVICSENPDIVLLDLMLPGQDGLTICRQVRTTYHGKVLMLTASDDDFDHVAALETGADDFVTKPVKPRVLLARVRTLLRRGDWNQADKASLTFGRLCISKASRSCHLADEAITLTDSEFDLLLLLAEAAGEVLSRDTLTRALRGIDYDGIDRSVDNRIVSLRKKLKDDATNPQGIVTVRGKGYLFVADGWDQ